MSKKDAVSTESSSKWKRIASAAVLAAGVLFPTAASAHLNPRAANPLEQRVLAVRRALEEKQLQTATDASEFSAEDQKPIKLAQWMNWGNWANWNNWVKWNDWNNWKDWHNWNDWSNWGKFSNY